MNLFPQIRSSRGAVFPENERLNPAATGRVPESFHRLLPLVPLAMAVVSLGSEPPKPNGTSPLPTITDANWMSIDSGYEFEAKDDLYVNALAVDGRGNLYLTHSSGFGSDPVACLVFDGTKWSPRFWDSLMYEFSNPFVEALALTIDGRGQLFVGGYSFGTDSSFGAFGEWTGDQPTYTGYLSTRGQRIAALASDGANLVYLGGTGLFEVSASRLVDTFGVAKWDGTNFWALGDGLPYGVQSLAVGRDGTVYAGSAVNGVVSRWDGNSWTELGPRFSGTTDVAINTLAIDGQGNLYAGGHFSHVGGQAANGLARWNGTSWSPLDLGVSGTVYALAVDARDRLFVGGAFKRVANISANNIAMWDGRSWSAMGAGVQDAAGAAVLALGLDPIGNLFVGGSFSRAGTNHVNLGIAKVLLQGPLPNQLSIRRDPGGAEVLTFLGTPGQAYALDHAGSLSSPIEWIAHSTNSAATGPADSVGYVTFTNDLHLTESYFRIRSVP